MSVRTRLILTSAALLITCVPVIGEEKPRLDRHGDPLPSGAIVRCGSGRLCHTHSVTALAFSPDGKMLASGGDDGYIRVWEPISGRPLVAWKAFADKGNLPYEPFVRWLTFSPNGTVIASFDQKGRRMDWDTRTGRTSPPDKGSFAVGKDAPIFLTSSASLCGRWAALAHGSVDVWDRNARRTLRTLEVTGNILATAISPRGRLVAVGTAKEGLIRLWDAQTGKVLHPLMPEPYYPHSTPEFSPDGKWIVTCSMDHAVRLWEADTGREVKTLRGHDAFVVRSLFVLGGKAIASGGYDRKVILWDVPGGRQRGSLTFQGEVRGLMASPDGKLLAVQGCREFNDPVHLIDAASLKELYVFKSTKADDWCKMMSFSPDGKSFSMCRAVSGPAVWDVGSGNPAAVPNRDPENVVYSEVQSRPRGPASGRLSNWDVVTGRVNLSFSGNESVAVQWAVSADGRQLATCDGTQDLHVWDVASAKLSRTFHNPYGCRSVQFAPDGKRLASVGEFGVLIWDLTEGTLARRPENVSALWEDLKSSEASIATSAALALEAQAERTVPFLRDQLRAEEKRVSTLAARLISELDDERFSTREKAMEELIRRGRSVEDLVRRSLATPTISEEARRRLREIVGKMPKDKVVGLARPLRAIRVLEAIGTKDARLLLEEMVRSNASADIVQEARISLDRLSDRWGD